jgi:preprotein translocase subunit SecE
MDFIPKTQDTWQEWLMVGGYLAFLLLAVWGVFRSPSK